MISLKNDKDDENDKADGFSMTESQKSNSGNPGKWELFNHIKEECVKDPFYMTKILLTTVGKNTIDIVVRIALYVIVVYPALTMVLHVPNGVAALLVVVGIILYHSSLAIYHRLVNEAKDNGRGEKKNGLSGV